MTSTHVNGSTENRPPLINVTQVSVDGEDVNVPIRTKKTPNKLKPSDEGLNTPGSRSSIANRYQNISSVTV